MRKIATIIALAVLGSGMVVAQQPPKNGGPRDDGRPGAPRGEQQRRGPGYRPMTQEQAERMLGKLPPERRKFIEDRFAELKRLPAEDRRRRMDEIRREMLPGGRDMPEEFRRRGGHEQWWYDRIRLRVAQKVALRVLERRPGLREELAALEAPERIAKLRDVLQQEMRSTIRAIYLPEAYRDEVGPGKSVTKERLAELTSMIAEARKLAVTNAIEAMEPPEDREVLRRMAADPKFVDRLVREFGVIDVDLGPKAGAELRGRRYQKHLEGVVRRIEGGDKPPRPVDWDRDPNRPKPENRRPRGDGPPGEGPGPNGFRPRGDGPPDGGRGNGPGPGPRDGRRPGPGDDRPPPGK